MVLVVLLLLLLGDVQACLWLDYLFVFFLFIALFGLVGAFFLFIFGSSHEDGSKGYELQRSPTRKQLRLVPVGPMLLRVDAKTGYSSVLGACIAARVV